MLPIQIMLLLWFLFAIIKVWGRYRKEELGASAAVGWSILWLTAGVIVTIPNATFYLAHWVGVKRGADLIIYGALAFIFFMLFRLMVKVEQTDRNLTAVVRKLALTEEERGRSKPLV